MKLTRTYAITAPSGREWKVPVGCIEVTGGDDFFIIPARDVSFVRLVCDGVFSDEQADDVAVIRSSPFNTAGYKMLKKARNDGCLKPDDRVREETRRRAIHAALALSSEPKPSTAKRARGGSYYVKKRLVDEASFTVDLEGFGNITFKTPKNKNPNTPLIVLATEQHIQRVLTVLQGDLPVDAIKPRGYRARGSGEGEHVDEPDGPGDHDDGEYDQHRGEGHNTDD